MPGQRYMREDLNEYDMKERYKDERRRSRSKSRSKRYRRHGSHSRSRSRSIDRRRRRHRTSRSRSRSRSGGYSSRHDRRFPSRRPRNSRSRSRSNSHARRRSRSITPTTSAHDNHRSRPHNPTERQGNRYRNDNDNKNAVQLPQSHHEESNASSSNSGAGDTNLEDLPLPKQEAVGAYYNLDADEPIDKERIHREMEEKLRQALAKEGKVYPPPKPEASHPVFANDGSFLEIFKKMQEAQMQPPATISPAVPVIAAAASTSTAPYVAATATGKSAPPPLLVGRRRGGKDKDKEEMTVTLETAPFDPRFPNQNQTRYCYQSYIDFHRCQKLRGEEYEPCNYFKKVFTSMCPTAWVEKWNDQRDSGTFPGRI